MVTSPRTAGLLAGIALLAAGCGSGRQPPLADAPPVEHEHHAPHGGTLVEMGDEFAHVEMVFDPTEGRLTAYVLDGEAEEPIRLPDRDIGILIEGVPEFVNRPLVLTPVADVLTGETAGDTSQFTLVAPAFKRLTSLRGVVSALTVRGRLFQDLRFEASGGGS